MERMRFRLLLGAALVAIAPAAEAATYVWNGATNGYNTATDWTPNTVPGGTDTAEFNTTGAANANITTVQGSVGTLQFDSGAPAYTLNVATGAGYALNGTGVVDNAANTPTISLAGTTSTLSFNNSATAANINIITTSGSILPGVSFNNSSSAGTSNITLNGTGAALTFNDSSTAAGATINASGNVTFNTSSTAGSANITISGGGGLTFNNSSTAGTSKITLNSTTINLYNTATLGSATVAMTGGAGLNFNNNTDGGIATVTMDNSGNTLDFSGSLGPANNSKLGIGSVTGGANDFVFLGGNTVSIGTNNASTTLGAVISDCGPDCTATGAGLPITGGVLAKVGTGTLILTAANTYTGGTVVSAGTLSIGNGGAGASIIGNVSDNAALVFNHSDAVAFSGVISGSGTLTQTGTGTLSLSAVNTYTGTTTISSGTLALTGSGSIAKSSLSDSGTFDISGTTSGASIVSLSGTGGVTLGAKTLTLSNGNDTYAGAISGTGGLTLSAGHEILTGTSSFTGPTAINGGTLSVNGSIKSSAVAVNNGGTLGGTGTVGPTTVNNGGTIAPGNSIGTINVAGNLVLLAGSTYHAELSPTANDKILASGTASVNGTLLADFQSGVSYTTGTRYTLITSSGALSGTFSSLSTLNLPTGLYASLSYDSNDAYLTLLNPQDGQIHAALTGAYIEDERLIRDAVLDHLLVPGDGVRVWGEGFAAYGVIGSANALQHNHSGFIAGVDLPIADGLTAGIASAWTGYKASMPSHASRAVGETGHVVGYLGWAEDAANDSTPSGGWMLKAGGEYGWGNAAINRVSGSDTDSNHESANTAQIFGEAAFRDHFEGADLEPHADIIWMQTQNGAFQETGGPSALNGAGISESVSLARLGVRGLGRYIDLGSGISIAPSLDIGWQAALSSPTPGMTVNFNNGAGSAQILGTPVAGNAGTAQLGVAVKLGDSADLHIGYDGIFSQGEVDHGVTARLEWRF